MTTYTFLSQALPALLFGALAAAVFARAQRRDNRRDRYKACLKHIARMEIELGIVEVDPKDVPMFAPPKPHDAAWSANPNHPHWGRPDPPKAFRTENIYR